MAYFLDSTLAQLVRTEQQGAKSYSAPRPSAGGQAPAGRRNKFAAPCLRCGKRVPEGEGSLEKTNGTWVTTHIPSCP